MTDAELTQHIKDCGKHMLACYERFEAFGDPADRQAAVDWLEAQKQAQEALSPANKSPTAGGEATGAALCDRSPRP